MARHWFGQSLTDWSMTLGAMSEAAGVTSAPVSAIGPVTVTFWNAASGGTQHTDLLDASGNGVSQITTADGTGALGLGTIPRFRGPDGVTEMWADAGGARYLMVCTDLGGDVVGLDARVGGLESEVTTMDDSPAWVWRNPATGVWPVRPATGRRVVWVDTLPETPSPPAIGGAGMIDNLDLYFGSA